MQYEILGKTVPVVEATLKRGETMFTHSRALRWQTEGIKMSTNARGGVMKSLGRMFTGESIFMSSFTAEVDGAKVAFATTVPGDIIILDMSQIPYGMIFQKNAFLCAEDDISLSVKFAKRISAALFGGEGFILQEAKGNGMLFLEVDGDPVVKELAEGEVLKVDTGNVGSI